MPPQKPTDVGPLDSAALICEIAMVVILVMAGHGFEDGWRGWAVGAFLAFVAMGIWVQWMGARSPKRLPQPTRLVVQIMLFITVALYAAAGGIWMWGVGFAMIATGVFIAVYADEIE
jgi:hypothetical protein